VGLGDKLKDLTKQAQETVAEHRDQIHEAVDGASLAADRRTGGKHSAKIAKVGQKAGEAIDHLAGGREDDSASAEPRGTPPPAGR
jgi:ABC-type transporter Mla subunit MlaD